MTQFKFFLVSLVQAVVGTLVFGTIISLGTIYGLGYSVWLSITLKKWYAFLEYWYKMILGLLVFIGNILRAWALSLDIYANVHGEIIEDAVTAKDNTMFGDPYTTISASIGKLEIEGQLNFFGRVVLKALNIAFWQQAHAVDSWNYKVEKAVLDNKYFKKLTL